MTVAPSPRVRGEGWGEGDFPCERLSENPPHPDCFGRRYAPPRQSDLSPQAGRGDRKPSPDQFKERSALSGSGGKPVPDCPSLALKASRKTSKLLKLDGLPGMSRPAQDFGSDPRPL